MPYLSLDVGCGKKPQGQISIDIDASVKPTIIADAHNLPFKSHSFTRIIADNILEHLQNPCKALGEFKRVARKAVIIVPDARGMKPVGVNEEADTHLFSWNKWTIKKLLNRFWSQVKIYERTNGWMYATIPHLGYFLSRIVIKLVIKLCNYHWELVAVCSD